MVSPASEHQDLNVNTKNLFVVSDLVSDYAWMVIQVKFLNVGDMYYIARGKLMFYS